MQSNSIRASMMNLLKTKFHELSLWKRIESDIAIMCSELPEPTTEEKKKEFVRDMDEIKLYLSDKGIESQDLVFIDEEVERHKYTRTMSLYIEEEDDIDNSIIEKYSRLGMGTEGVVGIHHPFNYTQLSKLTNGVFNKTGLIKFYISKERKIYGKIIAEVWEHSQKIPIATLCESKKIDKGTGEPEYRKIFLFGNKINTREVSVLKEINIPLYVYRFITDVNVEMILLSTNQCEIGDYVVEGVLTECSDYKMLTDSAKLPTKLPFLFAQTVKNRIIQFSNHKELSKKLKELDFNRENAYEYPFTIKKKDRAWKLLQPEWYKLLIWSWLTHSSKGLFNNYPMHLMVIGPKHSGKSLLLNGLHSRSKENRDVFSGSSSTLKSLVPSFKYNPAKLGYLAESNRFAFCDEFLRCIVNTRTTTDGSDREESVAIMNDLLEHQKRQAGSGVSSVNVNMTARIIATTNPVRGIKNVTDMTRVLDESFLSRWMVYYQNDEHVQMIRKSNDSDLKFYNYNLKTNDWISIIDYLHTFHAKYDMTIVEDIYKSVPIGLPEALARHYDARHKHHIECIMDGLVKSRCLLDNDMSFEANIEDYKNLKKVWFSLISSWMNNNNIADIDINDRILYLPEATQYLYGKICEFKKPVSRATLRANIKDGMDIDEFTEGMIILKETEMIHGEKDSIIPHYIKKPSEVKLHGLHSK